MLRQIAVLAVASTLRTARIVARLTSRGATRALPRPRADLRFSSTEPTSTTGERR